ncbi:substrate import-associated zinc metallohydrolase lipoprotein [Chitinophaga costaii]|uniref:Substrate import-associated zinc metallohydrolase lipoprotein n=1 Tax=Chitinophaga costaii TaxID=1335309 RepID=A0A1C4EF40_9BACT|nr:substrate import-associated zinc metallohydrolase lipoprotein [Chitinophaga costaii]PUZ23865.1 hypothetical protein DCM91_13815 [Chitinophaga costaii]SCC42205.1 substrate import-associated zinc metallohydrolase lipoprotein [Chitinophaga costaii]
MKFYKTVLLLLIITSSITACRKDKALNADITGLGGDTWAQGPIDKWLYDSMVVTNNIEMKYKWDQSEFDMEYTLVPPLEEQVIPTAKAVIRMWINPYNEEAGDSSFMKIYSPKQIVLSGSLAVQTDGSAVQGLAEGGLKILLFGINSFDPTNFSQVSEMGHLMHHEFTHILNQKKAYPIEFNKVTPDGYSGNWTVAAENSWTIGFVSNYARKEPGEDFAEQTSYMLIMGKAAYDSVVQHPFPDFPDSLNNDDGIAKLKAKEKLVVDYFKDAYNLDFYSLQNKVQEGLKKVGH